MSQSLKLHQIAIIGVIVGVSLHVCAAYALLGTGGGSDDGRPPETVPPAAQRTPTPGPLPDRQSCAEIRNTEYRSDTERQWFLRNCAGAQLGKREDREPQEPSSQPLVLSPLVLSQRLFW
jgi:hypothetical protein